MARLRDAAPAAAPVAVVAGDPCFDRILTSQDSRDRYRTALGVADRRLIMLSSTWWTGSLLGSWPDLIRRLLAELPADSYQIAAALHPNIWHGHGPWQVRTWLGDCLRSGLVLLSEVNGWRAGMIAADLVIGDHGSVTGYGAATGKPVLLAAFADDDVAAGSPIARLGELAPRLDPAVSLLQQVEDVVAGHAPARYADVANAVTSFPGEALPRLRELFYRLMALPEPDLEAPLEPVPAESLTYGAVTPPLAMRVEYTVDTGTGTVRLRRYPAEVARHSPVVDDVDVHLICSANYPMRTVRNAAAVLTGRAGEPDTWFARTFDRNTFCAVAALLGDDQATVRLRDGALLDVRSRTAPESALPSAIHAWLTTGVSVPPRLTLRLGGDTHTVDVTVLDPGQPRSSSASSR